MTENKPVAWTYTHRIFGNLLASRCPNPDVLVTNVEPLYRHPPAPQVEAALKEATALAMVLWRKHYAETAPNWKPLPDLPGVLSQIDNMTAGLSRTPEPPVTDPQVEMARRKALKAIFETLAMYPWACDTNHDTDLPFGVLRDLVGQPRQYPDRAIRGYDNDGPAGPHPVFGQRGEPRYDFEHETPARLSVERLAAIIADAAGGRPQFGNMITYGRIAMAVHEAVYGKGE